MSDQQERNTPKKLNKKICESNNEKKCFNIAIFIYSLTSGGAERAACILANLFERNNHKIFLIVRQLQSKYKYPVSKTITIFDTSLFNDNEEKIKEILIKNKIDICIFNDHWSNNSLKLIKPIKETGVKTIAIEHNTFFFPLFSNNIENFTIRNHAYSYVDRLIVLSPILKEIWDSLKITKTSFIPNPLTFEPGDNHLKKNVNFNILFIARICHLKGIFEAIDVIKRVSIKFPSVKLYILGSFKNKKIEIELKKKIKKINIADNIVFTGYVDDISKYFELCSIHIMPSFVEGAPMSLYEAKSYGIPSVCFNIPTMYLADESSGCINIERNDIIGMSNAIIKLLSDNIYWMKMSNLARESIKNISNETIVNKWESVFDEITNGKNQVTEEISKNSVSCLAIREFTHAVDWYNKNFSYAELSALHKLLEYLLPKNSLRRKFVISFIIFLKKIKNN